MRESHQTVGIQPLTPHEKHIARELRNRRFAAAFGVHERLEKPVCHDKPDCAGCPYANHGFVCWPGHGECFRSFTEKRKERTH